MVSLAMYCLKEKEVTLLLYIHINLRPRNPNFGTSGVKFKITRENYEFLTVVVVEFIIKIHIFFLIGVFQIDKAIKNMEMSFCPVGDSWALCIKTCFLSFFICSSLPDEQKGNNKNYFKFVTYQNAVICEFVILVKMNFVINIL